MGKSSKYYFHRHSIKANQIKQILFSSLFNQSKSNQANIIFIVIQAKQIKSSKYYFHLFIHDHVVLYFMILPCYSHFIMIIIVIQAKQIKHILFSSFNKAKQIKSSKYFFHRYSSKANQANIIFVVIQANQIKSNQANIIFIVY